MATAEIQYVDESGKNRTSLVANYKDLTNLASRIVRTIAEEHNLNYRVVQYGSGNVLGYITANKRSYSVHPC